MFYIDTYKVLGIALALWIIITIVIVFKVFNKTSSKKKKASRKLLIIPLIVLVALIFFDNYLNIKNFELFETSDKQVSKWYLADNRVITKDNEEILIDKIVYSTNNTSVTINTYYKQLSNRITFVKHIYTLNIGKDIEEIVKEGSE